MRAGDTRIAEVVPIRMGLRTAWRLDKTAFAAAKGGFFLRTKKIFGCFY